jgi:hypothetical protein
LWTSAGSFEIWLDHPQLVDFLLHIDQLSENATFSKCLDIYMLGLEKEEK